MTTAYNRFYEENRNRFLKELKEWLAIPSISVGSDHRSDILRSAEWLADALRKAGLENVRLLDAPGNPVVYADWLHAPGKPTAVIYGHYDVQPGDPLELWTSAPFSPEIRDGKLYARGATDDKGQLYLHVKAIETLLRTEGTLPVNVKFCVEGEEEVASPHLPAFIEAHTDLLAGDIVVISDSPMLGKDRPSITYGLRGIAAMQIDVRGAGSDQHSGLFGGGVANPIHALSRIIASFHDDDGHVAVAGFYDDVPNLTGIEREAFRKLGHDEQAVMRQLQVPELFGEQGYSFMERTTVRPTLEIHTVTGGFQGEGIKPIVPAEASARLSCRLVGNQSPDQIMDRLEEHIRIYTPRGVTVSVKRVLKGNPFSMPIDHPYLQAACRAYASAFGTEPLLTRGGGSIPVVEVFGRILEAPVILMGFGLPEENIHGPNEYFDLGSFDKGLFTILSFWNEVSRLPRSE